MEILDEEATSCGIVHRTSGLGHALRFMLKVLAQKLPVERINILCTARNFSIFLPLADSMEIDYGIVRRMGEEDPPALMPDRMEAPCIIPDLSVYRQWLERVLPNSKVPLLGYASMLRLPLFSTEDHFFSIHFFSPQQDAFSADDIEPLQKLSSVITDALAETFTGSVIIPDLPAGTTTARISQLNKCPNLKPVVEQISDVAPTMATVIIRGETGTGKEIVADTIHSMSPRAEKPFVKVNCGAIPETLVESELFGHERGAFTGAQATRAGYFEMAKGGTLLLDEIGEMSLASQTKLLRVLDSGQYYRVGNPRPIRTDARILAATNRNLEEMVRIGTFRQDLYYRLCVYPIHIPPLRARPDDIIVLTEYFIAKKMGDLGIYGLPQISQTEIRKLLGHKWIGNVRELEFVVEKALIKARRGNKGDLRFELIKSAEFEENMDFGWPTLDELKRRYIRKVIEKTNGRLSGKKGAAAILGIHYTTLNTWLKNDNI